MRALLAAVRPLALAAPAGAAPAPRPNPIHVYPGRITTALRSYTEDLVHAVAGCRVKLLRSPGDARAVKLGAELEACPRRPSGAVTDDVSAANLVETCAAGANSGVEWLLAPGNVDRGGNKANGKTVAIPPGGGSCERNGVCQDAGVP